MKRFVHDSEQRTVSVVFSEDQVLALARLLDVSHRSGVKPILDAEDAVLVVKAAANEVLLSAQADRRERKR